MSGITSTGSAQTDHDYNEFERIIANRVSMAKGPLFTTDADGLFDAYLSGISAEHRQHYTCHCCRRFITNYGGLATITDSGLVESPLWNVPAPRFFLASVENLTRLIHRSKITGVFINGDKAWGNQRTGVWSHLSGVPSEVFSSPLKTAFQASAEKTQDYITLRRGLSEIPLEAVVQAVRVLDADAVDRSEKTLGVAKWLLALHETLRMTKGKVYDNLVWLAVAKAPPGWCHIRSTMISTLLDDVVAGLPFESIKARWNQKMHPLQYHRPSAPPKAGNIEQANKIVAKLESEGALQRRFARLDEVTALWKPSIVVDAVQPKSSGGAFDHLKAKTNVIKEVELPAKPMAWEKFRVEVLPNALEIEVYLPSGSAAFFGLVTAVNPDSPPMLQWDGLEGMPRNPVSWYFWVSGSPASQWGLSTGWNKVAAVCLKPCYWQSNKFAHQGPGAFFMIESARESRHGFGGYFPETLRSEYHGIRSVIEAHSRSATFGGVEQGNANGIALNDRSTLTVRVRTNAGMNSYQLSLT